MNNRDGDFPVHLETRDVVGKKLISPSAARNSEPIGALLSPLIPTDGRVLEIASGTGQHAAHMCGLRPDIHWQMSDIDGPSRASQNAYGQELSSQMPLSLELDVTVERWWAQFDNIDVMYCANMIHIAPWEAALGLAKGVGEILGTEGTFCLYGPFLTGADSAISNVEFDLSLKRRNSKWGVRTLDSVKHIFADSGLNLYSAIEMPRNNMFLVFKSS